MTLERPATAPGPKPRSLKDGLAQYTAKQPGELCWEWTGMRDKDGYGVLKVSVFVSPTRAVKAHRAAWEIANGPIGDGLCVCHVCDNRLCVRPDHMFLGTIADNNHDKLLKGRDASGRKGRHARQKGARFEREVAATFARFGLVGLLRTPNSGGLKWKGDLCKLDGSAYGLRIECKAQETMRIYEWLQQAMDACSGGEIPLLVFKKNRTGARYKAESRAYACLPLTDLLDLLAKDQLPDYMGPAVRY